VIADDPVKAGLVASLNRPGGNLTGFTTLATSLAGKSLELLRDSGIGMKDVGLLINPTNPTSVYFVEEAHAAARVLGLQIHVVGASREADLEAAFESLVRQRAGALLSSTDSLFLSLRQRLTAMATQYAIPAIYDRRDYVDIGGLMSYGVAHANVYRSLGVYTGRILKGEKPGDLPVQQPTRFEFVINLKAAKALGIAIPDILLVRADEVIE
jgi:putative ABC transport system substrate-binding protein